MSAKFTDGPLNNPDYLSWVAVGLIYIMMLITFKILNDIWERRKNRKKK